MSMYVCASLIKGVNGTTHETELRKHHVSKLLSGTATIERASLRLASNDFISFSP